MIVVVAELMRFGMVIVVGFPAALVSIAVGLLGAVMAAAIMVRLVFGFPAAVMVIDSELPVAVMAIVVGLPASVMAIAVWCLPAGCCYDYTCITGWPSLP